MAKKKTQSKRAPRAAEPRMYGDGKPSQAAQQSGATNGTTTTSSSTARPASAASRTAGVTPRVPVTTTSDYGYVLKDLRRLGILAAAFMAVLVALGFIIR